MTHVSHPYDRPVPIEQLGENARAQFLTRTYLHLLGAILVFTGIEVFLFQTGLAATMTQAMLGVSWLWILGAFVVVSWIASRAAHRAESLTTQYLALGGFVVAEAIIFVPMLFIAQATAPGVLQSAVTMTLVGFSGLSWIAFATRKDFSFLGGLMRWGGIVAVLVIVGALAFGLQLGTWFSIAMIAFAGAAILYDTSNIIHHYPEDRYVAAALELFASVALMLWYVLRFLMDRR